MNIRRFQPGEELALFEVYYSAIHFIAKNDYSEEQLNAWAPLDLDRQLWANRISRFSSDLDSSYSSKENLSFAALRCKTRSCAKA